MQPIYIIVILSFVIFLFLMAILFILRIGGSTFRQIIKSKLPGYKNKGLWRLHCGFDHKVKFIYQKLPKNEEIKIKSGDKPHLDEYAKITDIIHQHDADGTPFIMTMDDLPFSVFLKKHFLDKWFPKIDELIVITRNVIDNKLFEDAADVKLIIQEFVQKLSPEIKHIPGGNELINSIVELENNPDYEGKPPIILLVEYHTKLLKLKEIMLKKNRQFVNVFDLFKTTGYLKSLKNTIFESWQNGVLAAQQSQENSKSNKVLMYVIIAVGVLSIISMVMTYQSFNTIKEIQTNTATNRTSIKHIYDALYPPVITTPDVNTPTVPPLSSPTQPT